jgi:ribonuclease P protein component
MTDERFLREARVLRGSEFDAVFGEGRSRADDVIIVYARPRPQGGGTRLGLVVGRKFGNAVRRNAWKRRFREAFRRRRDDLPEDHDFVVLPRSPGAMPAGAAAERSLVTLARDAARFYAQRGAKRSPKR